MKEFSLEYLYLECNVRGHCLGAELKTPLIQDGKSYEELFILKILLSENEETLLVSNVANGIDTNNTRIKVLAFVDGQNPSDASEYSINTNAIIAINRIC